MRRVLEGELRPFSSSIHWKVPLSVPDVLSVRLGRTPAELNPALTDWRKRLVDSLR